MRLIVGSRSGWILLGGILFLLANACAQRTERMIFISEPKELERVKQPIKSSCRRLTEQLQLSNLTFHDLRHDVASTLTMAGVPQRSIMAILGHRDPRMTVRYQHLSPGHLQNAMKALDRTSDQLPSEAQNGSL